MSRSPSPSSARGTKRSRYSADRDSDRRSRSPARSRNEEEEEEEEEEGEDSDAAPPLPSEKPPPLPNEQPPGEDRDDGWEPVWDDEVQAFYFYNRVTKVSQWENPRVPDATASGAPGTEGASQAAQDGPKSQRPVGGYDPSIHGDYDPNADYAKYYEPSASEHSAEIGPSDATAAYSATGAFNRFTGRWQAADLTPENFNDENKSKRQMNAYFDVDAAANTHDGRSLKAERAGKKLTRKEVKAFKEKRREKKEEKRRAWLRD